MGDIMMGNTQHKGNIDMLTPQQQSLYGSILGQSGGDLQSAFSQFLQPQGYEDHKQMFEEQYVKPAQQSFEQFALPSIQQRFVDQDAGSSSAMNQALSQSASDLSTALGSQFGQFMQGQQGMQQNTMSQLLQLLTGQTFSPIIQEQQGLAGPAIGALGQAAGGYYGGRK